MDKTQTNLERMRANDADWEEQKHPRAENGQFSSGSGSAGGSNKPSAEPTASSPLKKAAAAAKGEKAAAPKNSTGVSGYKGKSFTESLTGEDANTPEGAVHNFITQSLKGKEATKENVYNACEQAVKILNTDVEHARKMAAGARKSGDEETAKKWDANAELANKRINAAYSYASAIKNESATAAPAPKQSPLQKAAAAVQGKSKTRLQADLDAVAEDPHELEDILRERKAEIDRLTEELGRTKNGYKSQALHQEITRLKREYREIDESI